jgi:hypothetical protein
MTASRASRAWAARVQDQRNAQDQLAGFLIDEVFEEKSQFYILYGDKN